MTGGEGGGDLVLRPRAGGASAAEDVPALLAAAQAGDAQARERLIARCVPLVLRVGARICGRYLQQGRDDEVSVGLMAVNEAVDRYRPDVGASFAAFAEVVIRRRLIDHFRRQGGRKEIPFSEFEQEDGDGSAWSAVELDRALEVERERSAQEDRRDEIAEFQRLLRPYGITIADLVRQSPQHADARARAVAVARAIAANQRWAAHLRAHHALPLKELEAQPDLGVSRKTVERQRKFIIAVAVILLEGLQALSDYLPTA